MSAPVSVVVCSLNGATTIEATLRSIAAQTLVPAEVIVVDDGSTDATGAIARDHAATVVRHPGNRGLAAARNTGWTAATSPYVAFTDDDCRPTRTWLEELLASAERHPDAAVVGGAVQGSSDETFVLRYLRANNPLAPLESSLLEDDAFRHRLREYVARSVSPVVLTGERRVSSVVGASMMWSRPALERFDGFDESFRFGGEEEELCRRVHGADVEMWFTPDSVVEHDFEPGLGDTLRRARAYGRGNARLFRKHDALLPTVFPLPAAVVLALAIGLVTRRPGWLVLAAALPPALFSRWPRRAWAEQDVEALTYPYLQLLQETAGNVGLAQELVRRPAGRRADASSDSHPSSSEVVR